MKGSIMLSGSCSIFSIEEGVFQEVWASGESLEQYTEHHLAWEA